MAAMTTITSRIFDLRIDQHTIKVPLDWNNPAGADIDVHAAVVTREGGEELPYLLFLQGGPGHEAPRALASPLSPPWLEQALKEYRVVMLDQRGTGNSTPVTDAILDLGTDAVAEHLTHLRADSIVRDAEAIREHLGAKTWSTLGQSFGGFTTLSYLSTNAASLDRVFITGGLSAIGRTPHEVYTATYDKLRTASLAYYRRFPKHRHAVRRLVDLAADGNIVLPDGERVSVSRLRSLGSLLGSDNGWQTLWTLLEKAPDTNAFRYDLAAALPYSGRNPLYYVFHESCYADGHATSWAADAAEPEDFRADPTLLTGEHTRREWVTTVPAFEPWREVAEKLAEFEWPKLYDAEAIADSGITGAAAVYINDLFVPYEFSMETAALMPGLKVWATTEHEHSGLRTGSVLQRLLDLGHDRALR